MSVSRSSPVAGSTHWRSGSGLKFVDLALANGGRFAAMMIAARSLSLADFGSYSSYLVVIFTSAALTNVGLPTAATRFIAEAMERGFAPARILQTTLVARIVVSLVTVGVLFALAELLRLPRTPLLFAVVAATYAVQGFSVFLEFVIAGLDHQRTFVRVVSSGREVARLASIAVFLVKPAVLQALLMECVPLVVACFLACVLIFQKRSLLMAGRPLSKEQAKRPLSFSVALTPVSVLGVGVDWLPPMLVVLLGLQADVAQFATAWRWVGLLPTMLPFAGVALISSYARLDVASREAFVASSFNVAVRIPLILTTVLGFSGILAIPFLFGAGFLQAGVLALLLAAAAPVRIIGPLYRQILSMDDAPLAAAAAPFAGAFVTAAGAFTVVKTGWLAVSSAIGISFVLGGLVEVASLVGSLRRRGHQIPSRSLWVALVATLVLAIVGLVAAMRLPDTLTAP